MANSSSPLPIKTKKMKKIINFFKNIAEYGLLIFFAVVILAILWSFFDWFSLVILGLVALFFILFPEKTAQPQKAQ